MDSGLDTLAAPWNDADGTERALPPNNLRQQIIDKRLDLVGAENGREVCSVRCRAWGKSVTRALCVGAVEPSGHLRARKSATDGLDKGRTVEPRLAQARTGRKFAAGAAFARRAVALKASGLVPGGLSGGEKRSILCVGRSREGSAEPQSQDGGAYGGERYPPSIATATIWA